MGIKQWRAQRPNARSWDKISARTSNQTLETRDIFDAQQLDRSQFGVKKSATTGWILSWILGAIVMVLAWVLISMLMAFGSAVSQTIAGTDESTQSVEPDSYYEETTQISGGVRDCYRQVGADGMVSSTSKCYDKAEDVPKPDWYVKAVAEQEAAAKDSSGKDSGTAASTDVGEQLGHFSGFKAYVSVGLGLLIALIVGSWNARRVRIANLMIDTEDVNQHAGDQHIALPEEIQRKYDWFPDAGAHSSVQVSAMLSHMMLSTKGLQNVEVFQRAEKDIYDQDGELLYNKGEMLLDGDGEPISKSLPIIDEPFGDELFEASGLTDKSLRKKYSTTVIPYNPGGADRDKLGATSDGTTVYKTVADLIRDDWEFPEYEVQRPGGAYMVDTSPSNTTVLAMTRAGKGQTYIEPILDMWSREKKPSNMVINDPKGELLVKNYIPFVTRGFDPVQFNLINAMKTDIYNPLGMAADSAREGDGMKMAMYVENIADVFFPTDGGEDPVWPNAANNAFKRAAYGLIDYYLEAERELRNHAAIVKMDPELLEKRLDDLWGKVTLYNCYQLFVQLTSKKRKNPEGELEAEKKAGEWDGREEEYEAEAQRAKELAEFWEGKPEQDLLTLYFNATEALPKNTMRTHVANANNALRAMAGAEKMLASVYGIAITAMSFFTDPTISTLTSGKPSQNTDLGGLSFPRRMGVRFAPGFMKKYNLLGQQCVWTAYSDPMFSKPLGKDFDHSDIISREGWARYYFKGIFPEDNGWVKLELKNPQTGLLVRTMYFHFKKNYQVSLSGRHFVTEPVTGQKIVKNGVLRELRPIEKDGEVVEYRPSNTLFPYVRLIPNVDSLTADDLVIKEKSTTRAITQTTVRYSEKPKTIFLVTPPHLTKYAKIILILLKQLVDLNFDKSYMTKSNQKPLYRTRFMLDELGNLQSEGHGIANFDTMLSIGLGQEQQFTNILQNLQQLMKVYGEDADKIIQGNTGNIIFLKSTDDTMLDTLEKMSGTRHVTYRDSKTVTQNLGKVMHKTDDTVSYTTTTVEEPLIKYNDLAFLSPRNSIIYRAGDAPIWNRNETILPMSFKIFGNKIIHPGHEYTLQTIPTLSSAMEFDVRANQPDFFEMVNHRMAQAVKAKAANEAYMIGHGYSETDIERLDPDVYADEVMELIKILMDKEVSGNSDDVQSIDPEDLNRLQREQDDEAALIENVAVADERRKAEKFQRELDEKRYAGGRLSKGDLITETGEAKLKGLDIELASAYQAVRREMEADTRNFSVGGEGELKSADGRQVYIRPVQSAQHASALAKLNGRINDPGSHVYAEGNLTEEDMAEINTAEITADFYLFLAGLGSWETIARGQFEREMAQRMHQKENG